MPLSDLRARLDQLLPAGLDAAGSTLTTTDAEPPLWLDAEGALVLSLRVLSMAEGQITDVREQSVALGRYDDHPPARWLAYLEGTLAACPAIVAAAGGVDAILPCDLFAHGHVLDDPELGDAEAFAARLGDAEQLARWNEALEHQAWIDALAPCGLGERAAEVRALLRPSLRLHLWPMDPDEDEDEAEVGRSRFGGDPDLPPDLAWPSVDTTPLVFVAQLDLAEVASFACLDELPREGLLSLFYAPFPAGDRCLEHPVAVLHLRALEELERRASPDPRARLRECAIEFEPERLLPMLESFFHYESLRSADAEPIDFAALAELVTTYSECEFGRPTHRLLGHPSSIQGDPYLDVEMCRTGWEGWREGSDEAEAARRRALTWRLLAQIDATSEDGELLLEQDGGFFYFWLPADALAAGEFERARGCLQCH